MAPAFVSSLPLTSSRTPTFGTAVCVARPASLAAKRPTGVVRMSADGGKEKQSLMDWLYSKFMHNALWEGDEEAGYEPFFKAAMAAREEEQRKAYAEQAEDSKN